MRYIAIIILVMLAAATHPAVALAQTVTSAVRYTNNMTEEGDTISMNAGDSQTAQGPLTISMFTDYEGWNEWKIYFVEGNNEQLLFSRSNEKSTSYTLTQSGSYSIRLFTGETDDEVADSEPQTFTIVISDSEWKCPNAFSPNGDGKNDKLRVACKSIVKFDAQIFNRWGQKVAGVTGNGTDLGYWENGTYYIDIWDGCSGGNTVKSGVYFLNLSAYGSEGRHYKEKKAINVMTDYQEESERSGN